MIKTLSLLLFLSVLSLGISHNSGLRSLDGKPIEILSVETKAYVEAPFARIEYIQTYKNPSDHPIETEYHFPRTDSSIFHKFEAVFKNQTIVGQILEKQQASDMYQWNVQKGNTVAYSATNAAAPDIMKIMVGNIPPNEQVTIKFSIIQPLEVIVNKYWGLTLLSVLTERYSPSVKPGEVPNVQTVDLDGSRYKEWRVSVEVNSATPFGSVINPSHQVEPVLSKNSHESAPTTYTARWEVTLTPDRNFVIYFKSDKENSPQVVLAEHPQYPKDYAMLINFMPELNNMDIEVVKTALLRGAKGLLELKELFLHENIQNARGEFIFVIDRSGSMSGKRIQNLRRALVKFLQVLPKDSFFNIISFGSSYAPFRQASIKYTPQNLKEATDWIYTIDADMGGTEILQPLQYAAFPALKKEYPRTVLLLTDGDVYNPDEIIKFALQNSGRMRFSTIGIGQGASEYIITNVAKVGKGVSQFVLDDEDIGEKAIYMVKAAVSQYISDIAFRVNCVDKEGVEVFSEQTTQEFLLRDEPFKKWVYIPNGGDIASCAVQVEYFNSMKNNWVREDFSVDKFETAKKTDFWHKVAYDAKIKELDIKIKYDNAGLSISSLESEIVNLSTKYQVLSSKTAFIAVLDEATVDPSQSEKVKISNVKSADYCNQPNPTVKNQASNYNSNNQGNTYGSQQQSGHAHQTQYQYQRTHTAPQVNQQQYQGASYGSASVVQFSLSTLLFICLAFIASILLE